MRLIYNSKDNNHRTIFIEQFKHADKIDIAVAFLKYSGVVLLEKELNIAVKNNVAINIFCGLDYYQTEPKALKYLFELFMQNRGSQKLYISNFKFTFHPKVYKFEHNDIETIIIGSANFTKGGFIDNFETSICLKVKKEQDFSIELHDLFNEIKDSSSLASELNIERYTTDFDKISKEKEFSKHRQKRIVEQALNLDIVEFMNLYRDYLDNEEEMQSLKQKPKNYKIALKILNEIVNSESLTKAGFKELYEQLVGSKDYDRLWYSGSIHRQKETVIISYKKTINVIRFISENLKLSNSEMFEEVLNLANDIKGLGVNVITEILNTYRPDKYPILNNNQIKSLQYLKCDLPTKQSFNGKIYEKYSILLNELMKLTGVKNYSELDHFLNYVYWKCVKSIEDN